MQYGLSLFDLLDLIALARFCVQADVQGAPRLHRPLYAHQRRLQAVNLSVYRIISYNGYKMGF